jgi:anti-sigma B factor antagonist
MEITIQQEGDCLVLVVAGKLSAATAGELGAAIDKAVTQTENLCADLAAVDYVASAGLRVFISAKKQMGAKGGQFTLRGVNPDVQEVLEMTGLDSIFEIQ